MAKQTEVPPLLGLGDELVQRYRDAHQGLADDVEGAPPHLASTFRTFAYENMIHSLAGIRQSIMGVHRPPLLPVPRSFLAPRETLRIEGTAAAFRHLDSRLGIIELGYEERAVRPETPYVLHALSEGRMDNPRETNPGMIRVIPTFAHYKKVLAVGAQADECRHLLDQTVELAATSPEPALTRAGWLAFMVMTIHPFLDGNGRTARLLYLLVANEELPLAIDWGLPEQLMFHRGDYVHVLKSNQGIDRYDIDQIDPVPFQIAITEWSIEGARLMRRRLQLMSQLLEQMRPTVGGDLAYAALAVWLWRHTPIQRVADALGIGYAAASEQLEELRTQGAVERSALPPSRRTNGHAVGYRVTAQIDGAIRDRILATMNAAGAPG